MRQEISEEGGGKAQKGKTSFTERATMVNHGRWRQVDVCYGSLCFDDHDDHIIVTNLLGTYGELKSFESRLTIFLSYSFIQRERARARSFVIVSLHLP